MRAAIKQLETDAMELGKVIYEQAAAEQAAGGASSAGDAGDQASASSGDDDVIDAEYEVKDEKKD